uniref:Uncharacterized protein n=1 Tax=viral metagenome TaxID=1070528 RepID=A0A6C0JDS1_9ZZZZ
MPRNWSVGEPENVYDYLEENNEEIEVGDTIEYISNNQMGYVKYKVVSDNSGEKDLQRIADYNSQMDEMEIDESQEGGKRKYKKSRSIKKTRSNRKYLTRSKKVIRRKKSTRHGSKKYRKY